MMKLLNLAGCTVALLLAGANLATASQLAGSEWRPAEIGASEVPSDSQIFVRFTGDGKIEGHAGCNRFSGSYTPIGDRIDIGPLAATRMACPDPIMKREAQLFEALERAKRFQRDGVDLKLTDDAGNLLARFVRPMPTDPDRQ